MAEGFAPASGYRRWMMALVLIWPSLAVGQTTPQGNPLPARFKTYQTPYYVMTTDLPPEEAQEAALRMTRMAEEYAERTKAFSGRVNQRLPFYLFADLQDYNGFGGPIGSAGVYMRRGNDKRLMAYAGEASNPRRWEVVQHEGFHQFADAAIGELPPWINEGLAEYFGEALWTGDNYVVGVLDPNRVERLQSMMEQKELLSIKEMMQVRIEQWNSRLSGNNYYQAWAMTHFLAHGDGGKYQAPFITFMRAVNRNVPWEKAWLDTFGPADGFEPKWAKWWTELPDDPTAELYTRASLSTYASFLARAHAQKKSYGSVEELASAVRAGELKLSGDAWLPVRLLENAEREARRDSTTFAIQPGKLKNDPPSVVATRPDGTKLVATFPARLSVPVKVSIQIQAVAKPANGEPAAKPAASPRSAGPATKPAASEPKAPGTDLLRPVPPTGKSDAPRR